MTSGRPSDAFIDPSLQRELNALAPTGLLIGHRLISPGDEDALLDEEAASIAPTNPFVSTIPRASKLIDYSSLVGLP